MENLYPQRFWYREKVHGKLPKNEANNKVKMGTKSIENKAFYVVDAPIKHYIYRALRIFYIKFFPWRCSFHDIHFVKSWHSQKQPSRVVLKKRCSENMQQIYRRTPMPKFLCNFIEIALRHGCSLVNLLRIFRTLFPRNTSRWLFLHSVNVILENRKRFSGFSQINWLVPMWWAT